MPKHTRRRFDDHDYVPDQLPDTNRADIDVEPDADCSDAASNDDDGDDDDDDGPTWSTYTADGVVLGPLPPPDWVVTSPSAVDTDLGVFKTGKEADVSLLRRETDAAWSLLAVKQYRSSEHRMFHRDSAYLEGRKERKSRERRAMATRTNFGRELIAARWATAEFDMLARLWSAGAAVPYPVQLLGTELMMEFIGSPDGVAAPRLAQIKPDRREASQLYEQMRTVLTVLAEAGYVHGDLSAYNVLVDDGRLVLIDLPQALDLAGNPRAIDYLRRDCDNICTWFGARGVDADGVELAAHLQRMAR